jgi:hypothetical protein
MSTDRFPELCAEVEALMDSHHIDMVLKAVAAVLVEKADHVRENWQDEAMADRLDKASYFALRASELTD